MQKDPNDRSLTGKEQQQERITVKRVENAKKKADLEIAAHKAEIEKLNIDIEAKELAIVDMVDRIEKGKRLIGGAKIINVFPPAKPVEEEAAEMLKKNPLKDFKEKPEGGEKGEGKV